MTRKIIDCRSAPNDVGCTLAITGEPDELVAAAAQHAVTVHGHADAPELREQLRGLLADEPGVSAPGAFVQLIEFDTDRIAEWDAIVGRWAEAIGAQHTVRWAVLGSDRNRPGRHVAVVEVRQLRRGDGQFRASSHRGVRQGTAVDLHRRAAVPQPGRTQRPDLLTAGNGGPASRAAVPHRCFLSRPKTPRTTRRCP